MLTPGKYAIKNSSVLSDESKTLKFTEVQEKNNMEMETLPSRNNNIVMENANMTTINEEVEETEETQMTPRKTNAAFSPSFFPEPVETKRAKLITPEKE